MYEPDLVSVGILLALCQAVQPVLKQQLEKVIKRDTVHSAFEVVDCEGSFEQGGKLYDVGRFQIALLSPRQKMNFATSPLRSDLFFLPRTRELCGPDSSGAQS